MRYSTLRVVLVLGLMSVAATSWAEEKKPVQNASSRPQGKFLRAANMSALHWMANIYMARDATALTRTAPRGRFGLPRSGIPTYGVPKESASPAKKAAALAPGAAAKTDSAAITVTSEKRGSTIKWYGGKPVSGTNAVTRQWIGAIKYTPQVTKYLSSTVPRGNYVRYAPGKK